MFICACTCVNEGSVLSLHSLESNILAVKITHCLFMLQLIILCTHEEQCNSSFRSAVPIINVLNIDSMLAGKK